MIRRQLAAARNVIAAAMVDVQSNCAETWTTYVTRRALTVPARPRAFQFFHSNYRYWCGWQWHVDWLWTSLRGRTCWNCGLPALSADRATNLLSVWGRGGDESTYEHYKTLYRTGIPFDFKQIYCRPTGNGECVFGGIVRGGLRKGIIYLTV